jgi:hypothetical protein
MTAGECKSLIDSESLGPEPPMLYGTGSRQQGDVIPIPIERRRPKIDIEVDGAGWVSRHSFSPSAWPLCWR